MFIGLSPDFGVAKTVDLIPNGSNVAVIKENRLQYIQFISHYRLSKQIKQQSDAFFDGLSKMIDTNWLRYALTLLFIVWIDHCGGRMFNQQEVQILLGGVNSPVDLTDLRQHTQYGGVYDDSEATITAFWNVRSRF